MADALEQSKQDGPHALLARMVGKWQGTARTWFEPGKLGDEAPIKGETRLVLGGRFLMHEYEGGMTAGDMRGVAIHGYDLTAQRWETAWVDSAHNGTRIMLSVGESGGDAGKPMVLGSYQAPPGPDWGWRTTLELRGPDQLVITHYNIAPNEGPYKDVGEYTGVEIDYRRVS